MSKQRFYVDTQGNDDEAYYEAMQFACKISNTNIEIKRVIILISTKKNIEWFDRIYGKGMEKQLTKGMNFKNCKPLFKLETKKAYTSSRTLSEIVITCGLDEKDLFLIDNFESVKVIIAIPWLSNNIKKWLAVWNPIELRENPQMAINDSVPSL